MWLNSKLISIFLYLVFLLNIEGLQQKSQRCVKKKYFKTNKYANFFW